MPWSSFRPLPQRETSRNGVFSFFTSFHFIVDLFLLDSGKLSQQLIFNATFFASQFWRLNNLTRSFGFPMLPLWIVPLCCWKNAAVVQAFAELQKDVLGPWSWLLSQTVVWMIPMIPYHLTKLHFYTKCWQCSFIKHSMSYMRLHVSLSLKPSAIFILLHRAFSIADLNLDTTRCHHAGQSANRWI